MGSNGMSKITKQQIAEVVAELLDKGLSLSRLTRAIAAYLVAQRRTKELDAIMRDIIKFRASRGIRETTLTSAFPLDTATRESLKEIILQYYSGTKRLIVHEQQDKSLVGGLRLETDDLRLDISVHTQLQRLTHTAKSS